jgi:hypothetical protein
VEDIKLTELPKSMSFKEMVMNKHIRDLSRVLTEIKKGYQPRTNFVKYENGDLLADCHSILNRGKNYFFQLLNVHRNKLY